MTSDTQDPASPIPPLAILPERLTLPPITTVKEVKSFNYYDHVTPELLSAATDFIATHTDAPGPETTRCIIHILNNTRLDCVGTESEKVACWLTIRLTNPTNYFQVPRWHQDGRMYHYDEGKEEVVRSKYATTLLGPPTLMLPAQQDVFQTTRSGKDKFHPKPADGKKFDKKQWQKQEESMRTWLAEEYEESKRLEFANGEVVRFSWGREDSPVHSEPDITSDRVFMTVLYGSKTEIKEMCKWRNEEYGKL
ncbi:hypothetical protein K469DRAFT_710811 [Zopfia rhizophila CBS 207.26]|uniref:Uncharacterized protein n=1 Tax=Zopfia rhizophila CBS 207.26 TaxID=1314779 RepID=A0A6A6DZB3_9PEZI|nr:hypothetical protein K469DRAFT_710811 [Zopfia rhizophila CBS 207.26]